MNIRCLVPALSLAGLALAGCASIPADRGVAKVQSLLGTVPSQALMPLDTGNTASLTEKLVAAPIGPDEAVQLALLNNAVMRALYAELGFAQAEVYDASRLTNPSLGYLQLSPARDAGGAKKTWSLTQNFTELLFIGYRRRVGQADLLRAQQRVAYEVMRLDTDVRILFYQYIGAKLISDARQGAASAAGLSAELAERFHAAGNISALQLSRERAAAAAATIALRKAQTAATAAQGALFTAIGQPFNRAGLPFSAVLPPPVVVTATVTELQAQALRQRLDLLALRSEIGLRRDQLGHAQRWRWLGGLTVTAEREKELDGQVLRGAGASVHLPLFNSGRGSVLRAQSSQEAAEASLVAQELRVANDIAVSFAAVESARATVEDYRQRLVPLHEDTVSLSQQQQNYMLIGAFEVLAAKREERVVVEGHIEALRDFWISYARLNGEIGGAWAGAADPMGSTAESRGAK